MATEIVELSSSKITWKIKNFSNLNAQEGSYSDVFTVGSFKWKVQIYPKGNWKVYDHVSLFLVPVDLTKLPYVECSVTITSQTNRTKRVRCEMKRQFAKEDSIGHGWPRFMRLSELHDPTNGHIVDNACVIRLDISCRMNDEPVEDDA